MSRSDLVVSRQTSDLQMRAADPAGSAWVSANAGSGKTKVLVDRVLRLLLQGVEPSRILCLTYTKATAATMSNKVFDQLSTWAGMDDSALTSALCRLVDGDQAAGRHLAPPVLRHARRLFAQALETPGGLKIETIHAFCTRVLQMAPFEANVPAHFEVMDESQRDALLQQARRSVLSAALLGRDTKLAEALQRLTVDAGSNESFDKIITEALKLRDLFSDEEGRSLPVAELAKQVAGVLGIEADLTELSVAQAFLRTLSRLINVDHVITGCSQGGKTDKDIAAAAQQAVAFASSPVQVMQSWLGTLLIKDRSKARDRLGTDAVRKVDPGLPDQLAALAEEALQTSDRLNAIATRERTVALATVATAIFARFDAAKQRARMLDYDDLINATLSLLTRVDAAWVLYRLDAGIDHVLVDEAQDTTPQQWQILQQLTAEFTAGAGARGSRMDRTMFAVGDQKQSIYGFQGAAPEKFDGMRRAFKDRTIQARQVFNDIELKTSFRSAPDIVAAVDAVFAPQEHWPGLTFEAGIPPQRHDTARVSAFGAVDLWPIMADDPEPEKDAWSIPVDAPERRSGNLKLARRIAGQIRRWMDEGHDDLGRPFSPGDVLILLSKRGGLYDAVVKALKDRRVPVAGRDRLKLSAHPAVEDLIILGRAVLLPDDDLTLATLLKTPLFDLDDDDLMRVAPGREGSLCAALRLAGVQDPRIGKAMARYDVLGKSARRMGPFGFFAHVLGPMGGRCAAIHRLGAEAGDAVDAFLASALDFERRQGLSLFRFLEDSATSTRDIRRDLSAPGRDVRVMTVHGAKGLESKIVFLADLGRKPNGKHAAALIGLPASVHGRSMLVPVWSPRKETDTRAVTEAKEQSRAAALEERSRLLYVALTRAEDRLIICGTDKAGEIPEGSWYDMISRGLSASAAGLAEIKAPDGEGSIRRFRVTDRQGSGGRLEAAGVVSTQPPDWLSKPVQQETDDLPPLAPSRANGAANRPDRPQDTEFAASAAAIGKLGHLLLQVLPDVPVEKRRAAAYTLARARASGIGKDHMATMITQTLALLSRPDLAGLFEPGGLAEVPVAGRIRLKGGVERLVSGQIDRLVVGQDTVVLADFKTTARPPRTVAAIPAGSVLQMSMYHALVSAIYPAHQVRTCLIYTADQSVHHLPQELLSKALDSLAESGNEQFTAA